MMALIGDGMIIGRMSFAVHTKIAKAKRCDLF